jgi:hypothetical protein
VHKLGSSRDRADAPTRRPSTRLVHGAAHAGHVRHARKRGAPAARCAGRDKAAVCVSSLRRHGATHTPRSAAPPPRAPRRRRPHPPRGRAAPGRRVRR